MFLWTLDQDSAQCAVTKPCPTLLPPMDGSPQAPLSMEFSKQEYWSGFPFPAPGDLDPGIESFVTLALAGGFFNQHPTWEALFQDGWKHIQTGQEIAEVVQVLLREIIP